MGLLEALQQCKGTIDIFFLLLLAGLILFGHGLEACLHILRHHSATTLVLGYTGPAFSIQDFTGELLTHSNSLL